MFYKTSVLRGTDGFNYVCGATLNAGGNYDMLLTKMTSHNVVVWTQQYAGAAGGDDFAADLVQDGAGNIIITGAEFISATNYNAVTIKYNNAGVQQWLKSYNGAANSFDGGISVVRDASNNIYMCGGSFGFSTLSDFLCIKYNSSGVQQWASTWNSVNLQDVSTRLAVSATQVSVIGASQQSATDWKMATTFFNVSTGAFLGVKLTGGDDEGIDKVADLAIDASDNTYVVGAVKNINHQYDIKVIKLSPTYTVLWQQTFNGTANLNDEGLSLELTSTNDVVICGFTTTTDEDKNFFTRKYAGSSGDLLWSKTFDEQSGEDKATDLKLDASGNAIICGSSYKDGNLDYVVQKLKNTTGDIIWTGRWNGDANMNDLPMNLAIDENDNTVYVAGQSEVMANKFKYYLTRWSQKDVYMPKPSDDYSASGGYLTNRGQVRNTDGISNASVKFHNNRQYPSTYLDDTNFTMVFAHCHEDSIASDTLHRINMKFNKGATNAPIYPLKERDDYINYYLPFMSNKGERTPIHKLVVKPSVYTNTDVYFTHNNRGYVHYIVCRSGSPTADIEMEFTGQNSIAIDGSGNLVLETIFGNHSQQKAEVYTMNNATGVLTLLAWQPDYVVNGNHVSFTNMGSWTGTLVIKMEQQPAGSSSQALNDQTLEWSTYMGGNDDDMATDVACNNNQSSWFTGRTNSVNMPLLEGVTISLQEGDFNSLYVARFSEDLHAEWLVIYGEDALGRSVMYDLEGNVYVVGTSIAGADYSNELLDTDANDDAEGIYCVFNPLGFILCDTYIGGNGTDTPYSIDVIRNAIDGTADIWIAGTTNSTDLFPLQTVTNAYNQADAGNWDGFLMKIVDSESIEWATMFGGNDADRIYELDIYKTNATDYDIILMGVTYTEQHSIENSANPLCNVPTDGSFPTCQPAGSFLQATYANPEFIYPNYFVSRFSGSQFNLKWSTYLGMASDVSNVFYREGSISGTTINGVFYITGSAGEYNNSTFPIVASSNLGSYNQPFGGGDADMFIAKFSPINSLLWSTFIGSDGDYEFGSSLAFVPSNNITALTGTTETNNLQLAMDFCEIPTDGEFPLCDENGNNYMETTLMEERRTAIVAFNSSDQLQWSTLFGETGISNGMSLDAAGNKLYLSGMADNGYTFLDYNEGSELDYYQDFQFGNDNDAGLARFDLSLITSVVESSVENIQLVVYPNPSHGIFQLVLPLRLSNSNCRYQIFDILGQMVLDQRVKGQASTLDIDLSEMSSGVYLMAFYAEGVKYNIQLVKQ